MVGGKGESCANIGEGLATALQCFEDLQARREPNVASQKHCILVCNSPPYQTVVQETYKYANHTVEQLAGLFQEVQNQTQKSHQQKLITTKKLTFTPSNISAQHKLLNPITSQDSSSLQTLRKSRRRFAVVANEELREGPSTFGSSSKLQSEGASSEPDFEPASPQRGDECCSNPA